jgi:hypothetical protein
MAGNKNSGNRTGLPRRKGAGRKPKSAQAHWLSGDAGKRNLSVVPRRAPQSAIGGADAVDAKPSSETVVPLRAEPALLTKAERVYWGFWSPLAYGNGTLTDDTLPCFILLCQVAARVKQLWSRAARDGLVLLTPLGKKAHPLLSHYRGLMQRQEQLLARYGLAGLGLKQDAGESKDDDDAEFDRLMAVK